MIVGAGAAGLSMASQLRRQLEGAKITLIDRREAHHFQPGYTLIGAGLWRAEDVLSSNASYVAPGVDWITSDVAEFDPEANRVVTTLGQVVNYDFLIVATGLHLNYSAIEGMSPHLIGQHGITSIYGGPVEAERSARLFDEWIAKGGVGHFGRPATEMKCAGAPLKVTFLAHDKAQRANRRNDVKIEYFAHNHTVFSVPTVDKHIIGMFGERDININFHHRLVAIDPGRKTATYQTQTDRVELPYDLIHVVPPMRAPDAVLNSPLGWREGPYANDSWLEVDKAHLNHLRYPNVFGVGDINGVPKGKTAASVKWQVPVVANNLINALQQREATAVYNGYTSCPMVTGIGKAMLIEFDYNDNLIPSFPFIDPLKELWVSWVIEEFALKATYYAMLHGRA